MTGVICGTGSFVPDHILDNHGLSELVDTSDEWIRERTGVKRRHLIMEETTVSMAAEAGRRALTDAEMDAKELDLILVSTISSNVILPCAACEVQRLLGADRAACFDLNAACSGFLFAYQTAQAYIAAGVYEKILVIGSESLSNLTNWHDRSTCILFGDGAGAAVIKAEEGIHYRSAARSDGSRGDDLTCKSRHIKAWKEQPEEETLMQMDGRRVFQFAVKKVPEIIEAVLSDNQTSSDEIDYFLLHQANRRIVESVAKHLGVGLEKFPMNLQEYGNTSSASIPILMDELRRNGTLKKGQKLILAGFGAGLSWGASMLEWQL